MQQIRFRHPNPGRTGAASVPPGLSAEAGIVRFCCLILQADDKAALRRWVGEVFLTHMLPVMAARALDENYDFPARVMELN